MSELCLLGFHAKAREDYLFEGEIPRNCQDCIQAELDKQHVQIKLEALGVSGLLQAIDPSKPVRIGIKFDDVHDRTVKVEQKPGAGLSGDKDHTYHPFRCLRPAAGVAAKKDTIEDIGPNKYL